MICMDKIFMPNVELLKILGKDKKRLCQYPVKLLYLNNFKFAALKMVSL